MNYLPEFKKLVKTDFDEWKQKGFCARARKLNESIGEVEKYFDEAEPQYFTGNPDAELVLVHLNPKRNRNLFSKVNSFEDFQAYWEHYSHFGKNKYGKDSDRTHKSPFDKKQIRFLNPFGILPFLPTNDKESQYHNLEIVKDMKFQLELVPYGSPDFEFPKLQKHLGNYSEQRLKMIASCERKIVLFCGKIFTKILKPYIRKKKDWAFQLKKKDGSLTKIKYEFVKLELAIENERFYAGIVPQYALQGAPLEEYGKMCAQYYNTHI